MAKRHRSNKPPAMTKKEFEMNLLLLGISPSSDYVDNYHTNDFNVWIDASKERAYIDVTLNINVITDITDFKCPTYETVIDKVLELLDDSF